MNKKTITLLISALSVSLSALADEAPASPHTFTGNVGLVSDFVYRGISQTHTNPAVQGGVDYAHASGLYAGIWGSSISWVSDGLGGSYPLELDIYGGYKGSFGGDFGYDVGVLSYNYPGHGRVSGSVRADTVEAYGAVSWKWLTLKYSHTVSSHFVGWTTDNGGKTRGSGYLELNASYDLGDGWGLTGHVGHQKVKGNRNASYSDWRLGVTKDVGFGVIGLAYSDTNAEGSCSAGEAYCWGTSEGTRNFKDVGRGTAILSFNKSF